MYRRITSMLLTVLVFSGITAAVPVPAFAQGPMLAQITHKGEDAFEEMDTAAAFMVLYNTERLMHAIRLMNDIREKSHETNHAAGPMLFQGDEGLSQVHAKGPSLAGPSLAGRDVEPPQPESSGPILLTMDHAEEESAVAADEPIRPGGRSGAAEPVNVPEDQAALYEEIRELREMVDQLREEADAREQLKITEDEARDEEAEILEAAGREYSLKPPWEFSMDLRVNYSYNDYDVLRMVDYHEGRAPEYRAQHHIENAFSLESGVRDNLSVGATIPFIYKYDRVGTDQSRDITNIGDISLRLKYQPLKTGRGYPSPIFSTSFTFPTGRSPYDINPDTDMSTGSGLYSIGQSVSVSQPFDPVNAFASLSYRYRFGETGIGQRRGRILDEVDPGSTISGSVGFGYAVSYRMSLSLSLSCSYRYSNDYYWLVREGRDKTSSGDSISASLGLSTAWRITPGRTIILGVGKGLTTANPGFSVSTRMPISFDLR